MAALWVSIASARAAEGLRAQPIAPTSNGRIIVRWRTQTPPAEPTSGQWRHRRALANGARLIESADASPAATARLLDSLRADPTVEYAEPDYVR
ncbi:MAG TPA: hypothetical protein VIA18_09540, partial [Polyangia bacterium]|nr:hypothetical protein [Polyangia bacterium]